MSQSLGPPAQEALAMTRVAVLFCDPKGTYANQPCVDLWDAARDARLYAGPWPVVAHPPCARWCRLAGLVQARYPHLRKGEDDGVFASALASVRRWGGVLEHPAYSDAWPAFGLPRPSDLPDAWGGRSVHVEQWRWGHRAVKPTWLYVVGASIPPMPAGQGDRPPSGRAKGRGDANRSMLERLPKSQRHLTPPAFAAWLVELARTTLTHPGCHGMQGTSNDPVNCPLCGEPAT